MIKLNEYQRIKRPLGDNIALIEMGDFYEALDCDANLIGELCVLVVTKRSLSKVTGNTEESVTVPMTGFPKHSAEKYVEMIKETGREVVFFKIADDKLIPVDSTTEKELIKALAINDLDAIGDALEAAPSYSNAYRFVYATDIFNLWFGADGEVNNTRKEDIKLLNKTGHPLDALLTLWEENGTTVDDVLIDATRITHIEREIIESLRKLTVNEAFVLEKIAHESKMDTWFLVSDDMSYIYDIEERKKLSLFDGISMLVEGMTGYADYNLTADEIAVFEGLCDNLGIPYNYLKGE